MMTKCEMRRRLFGRCGRSGVGICQYCGRSFCQEHGSRLEDGQEICARDICRRKHEELKEHFAYKEDVSGRNAGGACGHDGCENRPTGQCSKCGGLFCLGHLEEQEVEQGRGLTTRVVRASLCPHCRRRRALWTRT